MHRVRERCAWGLRPRRAQRAKGTAGEGLSGRRAQRAKGSAGRDTDPALSPSCCCRHSCPPPPRTLRAPVGGLPPPVTPPPPLPPTPVGGLPLPPTPVGGLPLPPAPVGGLPLPPPLPPTPVGGLPRTPHTFGAQVLDVSCNLPLTELGASFGELRSLRRLVAHGCRLERVDDALARCPLEHLELQNNRLTSLPPGLIRLKKYAALRSPSSFLLFFLLLLLLPPPPLCRPQPPPLSPLPFFLILTPFHTPNILSSCGTSPFGHPPPRQARVPGRRTERHRLLTRLLRSRRARGQEHAQPPGHAAP